MAAASISRPTTSRVTRRVSSLRSRDGEFVLAQSLAIIEYLDETRPAPPLLPADPQSRATVRAMALAIACDVHPLNNLRVTQYLRRELGADEEAVTRWIRHWIGQGFTALEAWIVRHSVDGRHCYGTAVTMADVCLVPQVYNARRFALDLAPWPRLAAVAAALECAAGLRGRATGAAARRRVAGQEPDPSRVGTCLGQRARLCASNAPRSACMVTAVVLIRSETDQVSELAATLAELEGVSEVFSVAGQYDLVALVRVRENEDLARVISEKMRKLPGIRSSETLIAFKVYSKQDIEAAFLAGARLAAAHAAISSPGSPPAERSPPSADGRGPPGRSPATASRSSIAAPTST